MRIVRNFLAVALVATALCADRATAALPQRTMTTPLATRLIQRLSAHLRRVVPMTLIHQPRVPNGRQPTLLVFRSSDSIATVRSILSPFQFRLPPPVV